MACLIDETASSTNWVSAGEYSSWTSFNSSSTFRSIEFSVSIVFGIAFGAETEGVAGNW